MVQRALLWVLMAAGMSATISGDTTPTDGAVPCTTKTNENGYCVMYFQCKDGNSINVDGEDLIDLRINEECPHYLQQCCLLRDVSHDKVPPAPPKRKGCGWRNPNGISIKVTGTGSEAGYAEFPWMVAILKPSNNFHVPPYLGGGSLIHAKAVLTAAHVVDNKTGLVVRAGEWDTKTTGEIHPYQERDVETVAVHKDYMKSVLNYDIAILFLATPMDMAPNVGVVCLPSIDTVINDGLRCLGAGWGKDKFEREGIYANILKKVEVPMVNRQTCLNKLRKTRLGHLFELHSSFTCAGGEIGVDMCKGDGGSPLVCPFEGEKNRYFQSGIVAWGIGCGSQGVPGVYVDVAKQKYWIDDQMAGRGLDLSSYDQNLSQ